METRHHNTHVLLTRPIRRVFMGVLISLFFIASPVIILYTAGFRYDFKHHRVANTGVLSVDALPKDSIVLLNNIRIDKIRIDKKLPIRITNRAPGVYHLKIEKKGFLSWEKDITISSNQTTYIKDITLTKILQPLQTQLEIPHVVEIRGSPYAKNLLVLSAEDGIYEVSAYDIEKKSQIPILRSSSDNKPLISISPFFDRAYVISEEHTATTVYVISLDNPEEIYTFSFDTYVDLELQWNRNYSEPLFIKNKDTIYQVNQMKNLEAILSSTSSLWYRDSQGEFWSYDNKKISGNFSTESYYLEESTDNIIEISPTHIIAQNETHTIVLNRKTLEKKLIAGTQYYFNRTTDEWWFWNEWELFAVSAEGHVELVYRGGEKIIDAGQLDMKGLLFINTQQKLISFNHGYNVEQELLNTSVRYPYINLKQRELIFIDSQNKVLYTSL